MESKQKHCRKKVEKYIKRNDIRKFKSSIKRYNFDLNVKLKRGNSLLHLACKYGSDVIISHLIKLGADLLVPNEAGQLPVHLACQFATQGHRYAETDVVLPLVKANPLCLDVGDRNGTTARQMLQVFKERMKQQLNETDLSSSDDEESQSDLEEMWYKRLQNELEAEFDSNCGSFEQDYGNDEREHETYDGWAERMVAERLQRSQYRQTTTRADRKTTASQSTEDDCSDKKIPKISEHKRQEFERKMAKAQREHAHQMTVRRKFKYEGDCAALYKTDSCSVVGFDDVPWPCCNISSSIPLLRDVVVGFLFADLERGSPEYRTYLRVQRVRWHPDRFVQRCGARLAAADRDRITQRVNEVSQILNELQRELDLS